MCDQDDDADGFLDDDALFPAGGPTARRLADGRKPPNRSRKRRKGNDAEDADTDDAALLNDRAEKRQLKELEKARRIKSALYVRDGDDEFDSDEDEAFFAREREIAARAKRAAETSFAQPLVGSRNGKSSALLDESDADDADGMNADGRGGMGSSREEDADDDEADVEPVDSGGGGSRKRRRTSMEDDEGDDADVDMDARGPRTTKAGETEAVVARRPRVRGGFVLDSDEE